MGEREAALRLQPISDEPAVSARTSRVHWRLMSPLTVALALLPGCLDYAVTKQVDTGSSDDAHTGESGAHDSVADDTATDSRPTDTAPDACADFTLAPAGPSPDPPTCAAFVFGGWEMTMELALLGGDAAGRS